MEDEDDVLEPLAPQEGKQDLMVNLKADFIIGGGSVGSAKSFSILLRSLCYIDCPHYRAGYFRRNFSDLQGPGGLIEEATEMYERFGAVWYEKKMKFVFPSGASVFFHHLDDESKVGKMYSGLQYTAMFIDEVQYWSEESVIFLQNRLRSKSKYPSFMFGTCNPEPPPHWLHKWVDWYLIKEEEIENPDEKSNAGRSNQEKTGIIRYYVMKEDGNPVFSSDKEQLKKDYPHLHQVVNQKTGKIEKIEPKTFAFIGSTIFDNQKLLDMRPEYLRGLMSNPPVLRERLLFGNWYVQPEAINFFNRDWLKGVEELPDNCISHCRAWDKAYVIASEANRNPDYTAGSPMFSITRSGEIYLSWGFLPHIKDKISDEITGIFRRQSGERDSMILEQAVADGPEVTVVLSRDGAAGVQDYEQSSKMLTLQGITVKQDPMVHNTAKIAKFSPFSSAAQNGLIYIVRSSFPNQQTYDAYMKHLEQFHGKRSRGTYHDDWADATATAYNYIISARKIISFTYPESLLDNTTRYRSVMTQNTPDFGARLMNRGGHIA